jgi:hypothetical protein
MPSVRNIHDANIHFFICFAQSELILLFIVAAKDEENTNEVPTYPKYKIGG